MRSIAGIGGILASCLAAQALANVVVEPSVTLARESLELDAGELMAYAFDLDAGSELNVTIDLRRWQSEPLRVWLLDDPNYRALVAGGSFAPVAGGSGSIDRLGRVVVPVTTSRKYFVVLDNSQSGSAKTAEVYAYARTTSGETAEAEIRGLYEKWFAAVDALFELGRMTVEVKRCGRPNAYAVETRIVVCRELHDMLSRGAASGALLFVTLHELAHGLISSWGHHWINAHPDMIDRLAAMLFRMIDEEGRRAQTAEWLRQSPSAGPDQIVFIRGTARARRIAGWLEQEQALQRRWARRIVVPQLRTAALESMLGGDALDERLRERIALELARRPREPASASP